MERQLRDIEYFSVVAEHGNLGRAAEALGLSQPALSKSLRRLETALQAKLVKRTSKGVELTAVGSALFSKVRHLRLSLDEVRNQVADLSQGRAGDLRIGTGPGHAFGLLPDACSAMLKVAPDVTIKVKVAGRGEAIAALRNGELDFVVQALPASLEHDLTEERLHEDELVVFSSAQHRLAKRKSVTLFDLSQERWTLAEPNFALWQRVCRAFEDHRLPPPRVTVQTGFSPLRLSLIAGSNLLGYSTRSMVRWAMPHLRFAELHVKELTWPHHVCVVYRKDGYLSPAAKRFIEILKVCAKEIAHDR